MTEANPPDRPPDPPDPRDRPAPGGPDARDGAPGKAPAGLGGRFLRGGMQLGAGNWLTYVVNLAINIVIARILGPESIGLYAYVFAINEFLNIIGAFSLRIAVIQAREAGQSLYDTAFALSAALAGFGLVVAGLIAPVLWLRHSPIAAWMLVALGFVRVLRLLSQVPQARLERDVRYGPITVINVVTGVVPNLFAVAFAWAGMGAWSLVARDLLMTALLFGMSLAWSGYRFRRHVDRASMIDLMRISAKLFGAVAIGVVVERVDRVAIGSFIGNAATGLYHQARFVSEIGFLAVRPVSTLALNLYARVQDDRARLTRAHALVNEILVRLMLLGSVTLWCFPEEVMRLLFGEEWLQAAPLLRAFAVFGAVIPLTDNVRVLFYGLGLIERNIRVAATQAAFVVPGVLWASWHGDLMHAAYVVIASVLLAYAASWWWSRDLVDRSAASIFGAPVGVAVAVCLGFDFAVSAGSLERVVWYARPFLPPLCFALGLLALEPRKLRRELGYLQAQLRGG